MQAYPSGNAPGARRVLPLGVFHCQLGCCVVGAPLIPSQSSLVLTGYLSTPVPQYPSGTKRDQATSQQPAATSHQPPATSTLQQRQLVLWRLIPADQQTAQALH